MRFTKIVLAIVMAAGWACVAGATNWQVATVGSNKSVWFVDKDSIREVSDGYKQTAGKVWVKVDFSSIKSESAREIKQLVLLKCVEEQVKIVSIISYRADGSVIQSYTPPYSSYEPVVPDSVMSGVMREACGSELAT